MNASLQKELAALSIEEKAEVIDFLLPDVVKAEDEEISPDLMAELERRLDEIGGKYRRNLKLWVTTAAMYGTALGLGLSYVLRP